MMIINPMPWQVSEVHMFYNIQVSYLSCGDLLELFGGLQISELKLAMDDHGLIKVYP
jgi:hypothetical protein